MKKIIVLLAVLIAGVIVFSVDTRALTCGKSSTDLNCLLYRIENHVKNPPKSKVELKDTFFTRYNTLLARYYALIGDFETAKSFEVTKDDGLINSLITSTMVFDEKYDEAYEYFLNSIDEVGENKKHAHLSYFKDYCRRSASAYAWKRQYEYVRKISLIPECKGYNIQNYVTVSLIKDEKYIEAFESHTSYFDEHIKREEEFNKFFNLFNGCLNQDTNSKKSIYESYKVFSDYLNNSSGNKFIEKLDDTQLAILLIITNDFENAEKHISKIESAQYQENLRNRIQSKKEDLARKKARPQKVETLQNKMYDLDAISRAERNQSQNLSIDTLIGRKLYTEAMQKINELNEFKQIHSISKMIEKQIEVLRPDEKSFNAPSFSHDSCREKIYDREPIN